MNYVYSKRERISDFNLAEYQEKARSFRAGHHCISHGGATTAWPSPRRHLGPKSLLEKVRRIRAVEGNLKPNTVQGVRSAAVTVPFSSQRITHPGNAPRTVRLFGRRHHRVIDSQIRDGDGNVQ